MKPAVVASNGALGRPAIIHTRVRDMGFQQKVGSDRSPGRPDGDAQEQRLSVRVGKDAFLDFKATLPIGRGDAIGGRQGATLRVGVQVFGT
jgi:hypothetical protein